MTSLEEKYKVPKFYVTLKTMRYGKDLAKIESSIVSDLEIIQKIATDVQAPLGRVRGDFFGQLQAYRDHFTNWKYAETPEEMIFKALRAIQEKRWVGSKPKLAMVFDISKPRKSSNGKPFRTVNLLMSSDAGDWKHVTGTMWGGAQPDVKAGDACLALIERNGKYINIKDLEPTNVKLPDPIPGDPRFIVTKFTASPPKTKKFIKGDGTEGEFETSFLVLLVKNPEGEDTQILEASTTFAKSWQDAPNDRPIKTMLIYSETEKGAFWNAGDWQEIKNTKDLAPMSWPALDVLDSYEDELVLQYKDDYVLFEGTPTDITAKEGTKINFFILGIKHPLTDSETTMMLKEDAYVEEGVFEDVEGTLYSVCNRVKILVKVSQYEDANGKLRLSKQAIAVWNMDSKVTDEIEIEPDDLPADLEPFPTADSSEIVDPFPTEDLPDIQEKQSIKDMDVPLETGVLTPEEASLVDEVLAAPEVAAPEVAAPEVEAPKVAAPEVEAPKVAAPATPEVEAPEVKSPIPKIPRKTKANLFGDSKKGQITPAEQEKIANLRASLTAKKSQ